MKLRECMAELLRNQSVFRALLSGVPAKLYRWKPAADTWSLLEIVCHLHDEECEDFRARIQQVFAFPDKPFKPIDPEGWVISRNYMDQNYGVALEAFLREREASLAWLSGLRDPEWNLGIEVPEYGLLTADKLLYSWVAHDYHHIRQINALRYAYLKKHGSTELSYAGKWE